MTPTIYLQENLDKTKLIARYNVETIDEELLPVMIALDSVDDVGAVYALVDLPDGDLPNAIRKILMAEEPDSYIFVVECWITEFGEAADAVGGQVTALPPDDRREVVQIMGVEKGNPKTIHYVADIKRNANGSRSLGDWEKCETGWGPELSGNAGPFITVDW